MHAVIGWTGAVTSLIGFALAIGIHPALYGATADMLARGGRATRPLAWMLGGLVFGVTCMFATLHVANPTRFLNRVEGQLEHALLKRSIDMGAGVLFLVLAAVFIGWRLIRPTLPTRATAAPAQFTGTGAGYAYFGIGVSSAVIGFTTWPIMYLVSRIVTSISSDLVLRSLAYSVFLVALVSPFLFMSWTWAKFPAANTKLTRAYTRVLSLDYRPAFAALCAVTGVVFFVSVALRPAT